MVAPRSRLPGTVKDTFINRLTSMRTQGIARYWPSLLLHLLLFHVPAPLRISRGSDSPSLPIRQTCVGDFRQCFFFYRIRLPWRRFKVWFERERMNLFFFFF